MIKVYSMTAIMDLSFPGQRTAKATSCIPHDSVYMPGPRAGKSENGFFRCDTWLQIFQNDSKICEAEVTVTPLINKICKPCINLLIKTFLGLVEMMFGPVNVSFTLPKWQAVKMTFFAPWTQIIIFDENTLKCSEVYKHNKRTPGRRLWGLE